MSTNPNVALSEIFRRERASILATLVRLSGDLDRAEDALQEALVSATKKWSTEGVPANPGGWLMTTARRRMIDHHRRGILGDQKERATMFDVAETSPSVGDDRLALLFACCHPALALESRVALTLRTICGLTTDEIATAFVVSVPTMAQRIVRAKKKIKVANIPYTVPDPDQWDMRLSSVLATLYLAFTSGQDGAFQPRRLELVDTAIGLARLLDLLIPKEPEIEGMLALFLFGRGRHADRFNPDGTPILLQDQDRSQRNREVLREGFQLVAVAPRHGSVGQYWLQAAITAEHLRPDDLAGRNWEKIVELYDQLMRMTRNSPIVRLNRALAVANTAGAANALAEVDQLAGQLDGYVPFHSCRAHLLAELGQSEEAAAAYRNAISATESSQLKNLSPVSWKKSRKPEPLSN